MEGLNSVFSLGKRKARGYRSGNPTCITVLYFVAGKLRCCKRRFPLKTARNRFMRVQTINARNTYT